MARRTKEQIAEMEAAIERQLQPYLKYVDYYEESHYLPPIISKAAGNHFTKERGGLHGYDLLYCETKMMFQRLLNRPPEFSKVKKFAIGNGVQDYIEMLLEDIGSVKEYPEELLAKNLEQFKNSFYTAKQEIPRFISFRERMKGFMYKGFIFRPDLIDLGKRLVIELKTTDQYSVSQPNPIYLEQLLNYMAVTEYTTGSLFYILIPNKTIEPYKEYTFHVSLENLRRYRHDFTDKKIQKKYQLINTGDIMLADNVLNDPDNAWQCAGCDYVDECMKLQIKKKRL